MKVISKAIQYIQEHGWTRRTLKNKAGAVCLQGALQEGMALCLAERMPTPAEARAIHDDFKRSQLAVRRMINERAGRMIIELMGRQDLGIEYWNDHYARDADEVIEVLKLANERLDTGRG